MSAREETLRITASMTVVCALGAAVLGGVYVGTERYARAAQSRGERNAIVELLGLDSTARVTEVRQFLAEDRGEVVYEARPFGAEGAPARRLVFALDGRLVAQEGAGGAVLPAGAARPLGRLFLASRDGLPLGFVVEGTARGYKNRIRFLVGIGRDFSIAGVRVVEHEEDPGLGAEVATRVFGGQFIGRDAANIAALAVTRDPMPEDWRSALAQLTRVPAESWRARQAGLIARERARPIYAVTGATISSRALTEGLKSTVDHFRRRWALLEPWLGAGS
jgi:electron transport complex protein RnfG